MTFQPMSRPDAPKGNREEKASGVEEDAPASEPKSDVTLLAKMLAAVGHEAVSQDLALDLVLKEVVDEARKATRGTGAAIALVRDGKMVCRATTGNAPDLGVRVEIDSGIAGVCLITGQVQLCSDTEVDPRVNAEACRRLDVRSMLMAPIFEGTENLGIVEVFAAEPGAFSEQDVRTLELLAQRVAQSKKASEENVQGEAIEEKTEEAASAGSRARPDPVAQHRSQGPSPALGGLGRHESLTNVLVVLVIAAAILLGVAIGAGVTRKTASSTVRAQSGAGQNSSAATATSAQANAPSTVEAAEMPAANSPSPPPLPPAPAELPSGALIVTENGKVVYRSGPASSANTTPDTTRKPSNRLIHRVDPLYPETARTQHIEGPVLLNAHVLGDGTVGEIEIIAGDPLLAQAATQAVKQWKYQPYYVNGEAVERQERITIKFTLPPS
jgi:TonB family protein